ncbi:MAG: enoyl-CoA hydratase-related protein [Gammaproteobacteria bacterium]
MADQDVLQERDGAVVTLTLNRPDRLNAWTYDLGDRYFDLLDEADADPGVRVIVVTGAGRGFCSGMDGDVLAVTSSNDPSKRRMPAKDRRMTHATSIRKPIIGAINGPCAGFGLVQALHFDVRIAAQSAFFTTAFLQRGLNAEYGSSWLLPRIVGHARALDMILSGRRVGAAEAERIGLVAQVVPDAELMTAALAYARNVAAQCSPIALADAKLQIYTDWETDLVTAEDRAKHLGHAPGHRVDFAEGVAAMRERRAPNFAPLPAGRDPVQEELRRK